MIMNVSVTLNLKTKEASEKVLKAAREAMRDTVVDVTHDAVEGSPVLTGNNRRSIMGEASGFGGGQVVDQSKIEGAIFSTSGYGGFLETGTRKMAARPYFKPAADKYVPKFPQRMKEHLQ
ncbi:MAG: hypothetical protein MUP81_06210 [Dehalococcoidia bacterium]|nr:hypothetical protein [Dehalococcoidia bacterium]